MIFLKHFYKSYNLLILTLSYFSNVNGNIITKNNNNNNNKNTDNDVSLPSLSMTTSLSCSTNQQEYINYVTNVLKTILATE